MHAISLCGPVVFFALGATFACHADLGAALGLDDTENGGKAVASGPSGADSGREADAAAPNAAPGTDAATSPPGTSPTSPPPGSSPSPGDLPASATFQVTLVPEVNVAGVRRVNFAVPLAPGALTDVSKIEVKASGAALATARRVLAKWPDGSIRSVQIQIERAVTANTTLDVALGVPASAGDLPVVPVEQTLVTSSGAMVPGVWAVLKGGDLSASRVAGPALPSASSAGTAAAAWDRVCDYTSFGASAFQSAIAEQGSWLFDRPTALYRGYQRTGTLSVLRSAYIEAGIYRAGITGTGSATRIGIAPSDLKYHYAQGLAVHYLLTGDDRYREAAENVAVRAHDLWTSPDYAGGADFWTERHAGFALLAYEWALAVTDDRAATLTAWANGAVDAYLSMQATYPAGYANQTARCFAHHADAHGEDYGYFGCSPWMSAILADGLDANADRRARAGDAAGALAVRESLVRLGRFVATQGRDPSGKPYYWAGVGSTSAEVDDFDEHWGESAYVVALAWFWSGKADNTLRQAMTDLMAGFDQHGEAGQLRSFNWQCRSGVMAPFYARP